MTPPPRAKDEIARAIDEIQTQRRRRAATSAASWRAAVDQHLVAIDDAIADLRVRVNATFALIAAAVIAQVLLRLAGR